LDVFITVDTEVWCGSWSDLDARFPDAFQRYVYGRTARGDYALPVQFRILNEHGLTAAFFVEPLFSLRFGSGPLEEIVGLVQEAKQEVQLHLHTEWVDEFAEPIFPEIREKRQFLHMFDLAQQTKLIQVGLDALRRAGANDVNAFRAGSFGMGAESFAAVRGAGIDFDSSFDPSASFPINRTARYMQPVAVDGITEYPLTVFRDGTGRTRHAQLGACSLAELQQCLWTSKEQGLSAVVILSHNFELMNPSKDRADTFVVRRFEGLCKFLAQHRDVFATRGFAGLRPNLKSPGNGAIPHTGLAATSVRLAEQAVRRVLYR
jgi:hypothetical protein